MKNIKSNLFIIFSFLLLSTGCKNSNSEKSAEPTQAILSSSEENFWSIKKSGGDATSFDLFATSHAFGYPMPNLTAADLAAHLSGDVLFEKNFTDDPNHPEFGLGPVQNNTSCIACHNQDGRGSLPIGLNTTEWKKLGVNEALLLKLSIENDEILKAAKNEKNNYGEPTAVPGFTTQLFHRGSYNLRPEWPGTGLAEVWIKLEKTFFQYPDGKIVQLSKPIFQIRNPYDLWLDQVSGQERSRLFESDVRISPRLGLPVFGLGLLESITDEDLIANAKIDRSAEGVYGKPNMVFDAVKFKNGDVYPVSIGRFGLKATHPTVLQQSLAALNHDIGVTNFLFPKENITGTPLYEKYLATTTNPLKIEASEATSLAIGFYAQTLAVPPRRNIDDPNVIQGGKIFDKIRCVSCHTPTWKTADAKISALAYQKIAPYTDLLLHDMGEGLADHRQEFDANGREWKTRALWGIGLTKVVNPRAGFLHDGRAATIEEAILWHDGEARFSKDKFVNLPATERQQLIQFLNSL
jgi:CxxC motif-containing protein (DUF1111 family)